METVEEVEEQKSMTTMVDRLSMEEKANASIPIEIMEDILLRLPVRSILRFRSLSKPWLNRISHPSFTKLHFTRATRTALFIAAYDNPACKLHFLSAPNDGGPVTHLMTLIYPTFVPIPQAHYLNGLVFFSKLDCPFVVNPTTHHDFKLPDPPSFTNPNTHICYLFGFHESTNEHKVLHIIKPRGPDPLSVQVMVFSMSTHSWTRIHTELPVGCSESSLYHCCNTRSVCVNSVVHVLFQGGSYDILAFDLTTNRFSIVTTPQEVVPVTRNDDSLFKGNDPRIMKIKGCVGVVCHDRVEETNEMDIWILADYEKRVWVREIVTFPEPWIELECPFPLDAVSMDEIMFSSTTESVDSIRFYIYNKTGRCFKSLPFTLSHPSLCSKTVLLKKINCYVESMLPL